MFLYGEKLQNVSRKLQIINWKFQNSGKLQNNVIKDVKNVSSNGLIRLETTKLMFIQLENVQHFRRKQFILLYFLLHFMASMTYQIKDSIALEKGWCQSRLITIYQGDKQLVKNYRPVSLLTICGKVFERIIFNTLFKYFKESGFILGDSCVQQFISIIHEKPLIRFGMMGYHTNLNVTA